MKNSAFRALVILLGLTLVLSLFSASGAQRKPNSQTQTHHPPAAEGPCPAVEIEPVDANTALQALKCGNMQWQSKMRDRNWKDEREKTARSQRPFAVVLTCMDSRVPPELIFDRGLGEIFVIRVAGPVLNDAVVLNSSDLASLEYALVKLHVKLVIALGHTDCGAVKNAVLRTKGRYLPQLFKQIEPAIKYVRINFNGGRPIDPKDQKNLDRVSLFNAKFVHTKISVNPLWRHQPGLQVNWGLYDLGSGKVAFDPTDVER
jgi:carbonic anhydrase